MTRRGAKARGFFGVIFALRARPSARIGVVEVQKLEFVLPVLLCAKYVPAAPAVKSQLLSTKE